MGTQANASGVVTRIVVRIQVGDERMAATDDPMFVRIAGPSGRDFRLAPARGKAFRRGAEDVFVIGSPSDPETNVAHPALNDPNAAPMAPQTITSVAIHKGMEPIPNVRGLGEMDDRVLVDRVRVEVESGGATVRAWERSGPAWLGLVCGLYFELAEVEVS